MTTSHLSGLLCLLLTTFIISESGASEVMKFRNITMNDSSSCQVENIVTKREAPPYKVVQGDILEKSGHPSNGRKGMVSSVITTDTRRYVLKLKVRRNTIPFHRHWENAKISFAIDDGFGQFDHAYKRDILDEVIKSLERDSCVRFENITGVSRRNFPHYL